MGLVLLLAPGLDWLQPQHFLGAAAAAARSDYALDQMYSQVLWVLLLLSCCPYDHQRETATGGTPCHLQKQQQQQPVSTWKVSMGISTATAPAAACWHVLRPIAAAPPAVNQAVRACCLERMALSPTSLV